MKNINKNLILFLSILVLASFGTASAAEKTYSTSFSALTSGQGKDGPVMNAPNYETGFEPGEGFAPGYCSGQQGWTAFVVSSSEGHIDTANPASGVQELRISEDSSISSPNNVGCFSPDLGVQDVDLSIIEVDISITDSGGADYDVIPQAPSQGLITARVKFDWENNILVLDPGLGDFGDTGFDWASDTYYKLTIVVDPDGNNIDYFIDDVQIYSTEVYAGTTIEQVVLLSDNFQDGDSGDFDNLIIRNDAEDFVDARFRVTKDFTDDNPSDVEVTLSCFTGLPLVQSQMISEVQDVNFIVESFASGELDCNITETEVFGYSANYFDGTVDSADGCEYTDLEFGQYECSITNTPDPVTVDIEKVWIIDGPGGDSVDQNYRLTMFCSSEIVGGEEILLIGSGGPGPGPGCGGIFLPGAVGSGIRGADGGLWCLELDGYGSEIFTPEVIPDYPGSLCIVIETVYDSGVEVDNGCLVPNLEVSAGIGTSCTITNTVFFEGIPTLSQYGMAILALLMLGVGFVGFRRFV